jgi:hypothetical protein
MCGVSVSHIKLVKRIRDAAAAARVELRGFEPLTPSMP